MFSLFLLGILLFTGVISAFVTIVNKWKRNAIKRNVSSTESYDEKERLLYELKRIPESFATSAISLVSFALAFIMFFFGGLYRQDPGEASVIVNVGGTIVREDYTPGFGFAYPWEYRVEFNLFSQQLTYAGSDGKAPAYTAGSVQGNEVTAPVARGVTSNFDVSVTYNLQGEKISEIYEKYKSQENFTDQIVQQRTLSVLRAIPSDYSPAEFRGEKRNEAQTKMLKSLQEELQPFGIDVQTVSLQDVRFDPSVEESLKNVEVAQQKEAEAQANLRATEVSAKAKIAEAEAEAKANDILNKSLTGNVLRKQWIDAIKASGKTIVVPDSAAPLINVGE